MKIEEISNFAYDGLDRLVSEVESSGVSRTYTYDLAGNRLAKTETGSGAITYALGVGDRLATCTGGSYSYDTAGCVTAIDRTGKPDLDLTWNGQYQLTSVSTNGVVAESYTYDPFGRRASTTSAGTTIRHVYDGIHCVADIDSVGRVVKSYTWGPGVDNLLAATCHSGTLATTYYALTDLQGTVHGFADAGGNLVARYAYDAWGNLLDADVAVSALADNRYLFQGREYSWATGLTNFRLRWYDPATGRWLSKDPIGISGGLNLYAFCGNDPVNFRDPLGLCEDPWYKKTWKTLKELPGAAWRGATYFHFEGRDARNGLNPIYSQVTAPGSGWNLLPPEMSVFHDNKIGKPELKFIHPDGREAVFDGDSLQPMTNPRYKGTFNYVSPVNTPDNWYNVKGWANFAVKGVGHTVMDVVPYFIVGKRNERNQ